MEDKEIYRFLNRPRNLLAQIRATQQRIDATRLSMYPSAIRYDTDKVMSSPSDPMPRYAERIDHLERELARLRDEYYKSQDNILDATMCLTDKEQELIMLKYVGFKTWKQIMVELHIGRTWAFELHRKAVKKLSTEQH
jgi:DNA-directed RNA polymerase specialized sigma subunit